MWTTELVKMTTEVWKRMGTDHAIKVIWKIANVKLRKKDFKKSMNLKKMQPVAENL